MQAVILAAGRGVRMNDLTTECPKPMLPILGKPILQWKIEALPPDINEVIFVIGYRGDTIRNFFGTEWRGKRIIYIEQKELNGTGGAIVLARELIMGKFLVLMGDDLYHPEDLKNLIQESIAVLGFEVKNAEPYGLLEETPEHFLSRITERPHGMEKGIVNTGAYILDERYFLYPLIKCSATEYGLPQTLVRMGHDIPVKVCLARAWQPIGCPEHIPLGERFLKQYKSEKCTEKNYLER